MLRRLFSGDVEWRLENEHIDVHSFRGLERLAVHEARTLADLMSGVVRDSEREKLERDMRCRKLGWIDAENA